MEEFKTFLKTKKNLVSVLVLLLIIATLPLGLYLVKQSQRLLSQAAGEAILLGEGNCIKTVNNKKVAVCNLIPLKLTNPFPATAQASGTSPSAIFYRVAEAEANLSNSGWIKMNSASEVYTYRLSNEVPGQKQIWVEFKKEQGGTTWNFISTVYAADGTLRSIDTNGCGEILQAPYNQAGGEIIYKAPTKAADGTWETRQQDGGVVTQAQMIQKFMDDPRNGSLEQRQQALATSFQENLINCNLFFNYTNGADCDVHFKDSSLPGAGNSDNQLPAGQTTTLVISVGTSSNSDGCRKIIHVKNYSLSSPSPSPSPTTASSPSPASSASPSPTSSVTSPSPTASAVASPTPLSSTGKFTPQGTYIEHIPLELLDKLPDITGVDCKLDIAGQNLKLSLIGSHFGQKQAKVYANDKELNVLSWTDNNISGILSNSQSSVTTGSSFKVKIKRDDTLVSEEQVCKVNTSLMTVGARAFCRAEGKLELDNVTVTIFTQDLNDPSKIDKVEEKVKIDKDGVVQGLKTRLQSGRQYGVSIKAPGSIRKNALFTASEGTTVVTSNGKPFILPMGDIAPTQPDGIINSLDQAELVKQWKIIQKNDKALTADFNKDSSVNAIDWACMRYDFDAADDHIPDTLSGEELVVIFKESQSQNQ